MKTRLLFILIIIPLFVSAQENCRVLLADIDSIYIGNCKNGLAHGNGEAWGDFHYTGKFVKGYPNGKGKAEYSDGIVYTGSWKKGLRNGKGSLAYMENGKLVKKDFFWSKGKQLREVLPPSYKFTTKRNVNRVRVYSQGGDHAVWFLPKSLGGVSTQLEDMRVSGSSGTETSHSPKIGYENVSFPFKGSIKYYSWNKLRTSRFEVFIEIEILEPGNWIVEIQN